MEVFYGTSSCTLGHFTLRNEKLCSHNMYTRFIIALTAITTNWGKHRCLLMDEWSNIPHIFILIYDSTVILVLNIF